MPAVSYLAFSGGLDRRLPINVQDASRLWTLRNAYVTTGKKIKIAASKAVKFKVGKELKDAVNG